MVRAATASYFKSLEFVCPLEQEWPIAYSTLAPTSRLSTRPPFNGGTAGNPGEGAAGSVLVQLGQQRAKMCWTAGMSYRDGKTTFDVAAYRGLVNGLRRATDSRCSHLHVVGDNATVITRLLKDSATRPRQNLLCGDCTSSAKIFCCA